METKRDKQIGNLHKIRDIDSCLKSENQLNVVLQIGNYHWPTWTSSVAVGLSEEAKPAATGDVHVIEW